MKMNYFALKQKHLCMLLFVFSGVVQQSHAAISLDRTRVIFDGGKPAMSLTISNNNKVLPYLAQAWVEDMDGKKIDYPITALPPLQRVEPGAKGQVKIQLTGSTQSFPQDKESLMYFNLREIPPKSNKPNTLQIALQTRVKMFYRPAQLAIEDGRNDDYPKKIIIRREGRIFRVVNPTPYYITITSAASTENSDTISGFKPFMIEPMGDSILPGITDALGSHPVITYINDYGGRPKLSFSCSGKVCSVNKIIND
ncbi:TPA: fimbria/pilus periplasmic chaperone [Klebsiella aerogenes]|nr:fimbria/pilus periplasmic chaperone [Klebsiella aerogenes]